jgi:hypothetical protein
MIWVEYLFTYSNRSKSKHTEITIVMLKHSNTNITLVHIILNTIQKLIERELIPKMVLINCNILFDWEQYRSRLSSILPFQPNHISFEKIPGLA